MNALNKSAQNSLNKSAGKEKRIDSIRNSKTVAYQSFSKSSSLLSSISSRLESTTSKRYKNYLNYPIGQALIPYTIPAFNDNPNSQDDSAPYILASLRDKAPTHAAAINKKIKMTYGKGFDLDSISDPILKSQLNSALSSLNDKGENINEILRSVIDDYITFGGFALEILYDHSGNIYSIKKLNFICLRVYQIDECNEPISYLYDTGLAFPNLYQFKTIRKVYPVFNPSIYDRLRSLDSDKLPTLTEEEVHNAAQIIYYNSNTSKSSYDLSSNFYPRPEYISAVESIITESKISSFNYNAITYGVTGLTIVQYPSYIYNSEDQQRAFDDLADSIIGTENAGRVIIAPKTKENSEDIKLIQADGIDPDRYNTVLDSLKESIVTAHEIPSILLNIKQTSGWSNAAQEMLIAEELFQKNIISHYQYNIEKIFNSLLQYLGFPTVSLSIIPTTGTYIPSSVSTIETTEIDDISIESNNNDDMITNLYDEQL